MTPKDDNAVMISKEEHPGLMETLSLSSVPGMKEKLIEGLNTPLDETVSEKDVLW